MRISYKFCYLLLPLWLLCGCGGGSISEKPPSLISKTTASSVPVTLSGRVMKGPLQKGQVSFYTLKDGLKDQLVASTTTDQDGFYLVTINELTTNPLLIEADGGNYLDEYSNIKTPLDSPLQAYVPELNPANIINLTPLTHIAAQVISADSGKISPDYIREQNRIISAFYSVPDIISTTPLNPCTNSEQALSTATAAEAHYGLVLATFSELAGQLGSTNAMEIVELFAADASDRVFDGLQEGIPLTLNTQEIPPTLATKSFSEAMSAFTTSTRNNSTLSIDKDWEINLKTASGELSANRIALYLDPYPELYNGQKIILSGYTSPSLAEIRLIQDGVRISHVYSDAGGRFSLEAPLQKNTLNNFRIAAISSSQEAYRLIEIREHSIAPELNLSAPPEYTNSNSLSLDYSLISTLGTPLNIIVRSTVSGLSITTDNSLPSLVSSTGLISVNNLKSSSGVISLTGFSAGRHELEVSYADFLGNESYQKHLFYADFTAPVFRSAIPTITNTNLNIKLDIDENSGEEMSFKGYKLYQTIPSAWINHAGNYLYLDFLGQNTDWTLEFKATDKAGNSTQIIRSIKFDNIAPSFTTTAFQSQLPLTNSLIFNTDFAVSEPQAKIRFIFTEPQGKTHHFSVTSSPFSTDFSALTSSSWRGEGNWQIQACLTDPAGNENCLTPIISQVDITAPQKPSVLPSDSRTNAKIVTMEITQDGTASFLHYKIDQMSFNSLELTSNTTKLELNLDELGFLNNSLPLDFQLEDAAGNKSAISTALIIHDSQAPQIVHSSYIATNSYSNGTTTYLTAGSVLTCQFQLAEVENQSQLKLNFQEKKYSLESHDGQNFSTSISFNQIQTELNSPLPFVLQAMDDLGNSNSSAFLVTYALDTIKPSLSSYSFSAANAWVGIGQAIDLEVNLTKAEPALQITAYHQDYITAQEINDQKFTFHHTVLDSHNSADVNSFAIDLTLIDQAHNQSFYQLVSNYYTDCASPVINLISNDRQGESWLKIGDQINFSISPQGLEQNLAISASYNSTALSFHFINEEGYYIGTHTIAENSPPFTGTIPQLANLLITDPAGNQAVFAGVSNFTDIMAVVGAKIDSIKPEIENISLTYQKTGSNALIIGDQIEFNLSPKISSFPNIPTTPYTVLAEFNSETLNFITTSQGQFFVATYTVSRSSLDGTKKTSPQITAQLISVAQNKSTAYTTTSLYLVDTDITTPIELQLYSVDNQAIKTVNDQIKLDFIFAANNNINAIQAKLYDTELAFTAQSATKFSTTISLPYWGIETDTIILTDTIFREKSGNTSVAETYTSTIMYFTSPPYSRNFFIDTLANSIASFAYSTNPLTTNPKTWLKIGDELTFMAYPQKAETDMILLLNYNNANLDFTANSDGSAYFATYTVKSGDISHTDTPLQIIDASFIDSSGLTGPLTNSHDIRFFIDTKAPEVKSLTYSIDRTSCHLPLNACDERFLKIGDTIHFQFFPDEDSLHPNTSLTNDLQIINAIYNTIPLSFTLSSFDLSYHSSLIISQIIMLDDEEFSLPPALESTPQLQIQLIDLVGNVGSSFISTNLTNLLDVQSPQIANPEINAADGDFGLQHTLKFTVPILSPAEKDLIVIGFFNEQELEFQPDLDGSSYISYYSPLTTHPTSVIHSFAVSVFDLAGNFSTADVSDLNLHIVTSAPELTSVNAVVNSKTPTYAGINSTIRFSVKASPNSTSGTNAVNFVEGRFNGRSLSFTPYDTDTWRALYTVLEHDDPSGGQIINDIYIRAKNNAGNYSEALESVSISHLLDTTRPEIESITMLAQTTNGDTISSGQTLCVSDLIIFSVQAKSNTTDTTTAKGFFNKKQLNFQLISSNPQTYRATYSFADDDTEISAYEKISNVHLVDRAGNEGLGIEETVPYYLQKPLLSQIDHNAEATARLGLCHHADCEIEFALQFSHPYPDLSITAYFNTTDSTNPLPLIFQATDSTFSTWAATYTFLATHDDNPDNIPPQLYGEYYPSSGTSSASFFSTTQSQLATYQVAAFLDKTPPTNPISLTSWLESNSTSDEFLKIDDKIFFSIQPADINTAGGLDPLLSVTGVFNSRSLTFYTTDAGKSYITSYTVMENDNPANGQLIDFNQIIALDLVNNSSSWTISLTRIIDATRPIIDDITWQVLRSDCDSSAGCDFDYLKIDDQIEFSINLSAGSSDVSTFEPFFFNQMELDIIQSTPYTWLSTYTVVEGDISGGPYSLSPVIAIDCAGNKSDASTTSVTPIIISTKPVIESINWTISRTDCLTSLCDENYLKIGDEITFFVAIHPDSTNISHVITAYFNDMELDSFSKDNDYLWLTTYTVLEAHRSTTEAQELEHIIIVDIAGNYSLAQSTSVAKLIDATRPVMESLDFLIRRSDCLTDDCDEDFLKIGDEIEFSLTLSADSSDISTIESAVFHHTEINFSATSTALWQTTYTVLEGPSSAGPAEISSVYAFDIAGNRSLAITTSVTQTIDATKPVIDSVTWQINRSICQAPNDACDEDFLKIDDEIEFSINLNANSTDVQAVQENKFNQVALTYTKNSDTLWEATYTVTEGDESGITPIDYTNIVVADQAGNCSLTATTSIIPSIDAIRPIVFSLAVKSHPNRQMLGIDDELSFELQAITNGELEENGAIKADYNGVDPLVWTEDSPGIYISTYTVLATHDPQPTPLNLSDVLFYDSAGNVSDTKTAAVTVGIDVDHPNPPAVSPMFLATDTATYNFTISGEAACEVFMNEISIGHLPSSGDIKLVHEVSLDPEQVSTFEFHLVKTSQNSSTKTTARLYRTDNVGLTRTDSAIGAINTTDINIKTIRQSIHDSQRLFVISRAGIGEINELSPPYISLNKGLKSGDIFTVSEKGDQEDTLWLGMEKGLFKSHNRGREWTEVAKNTFGNKNVYAISLSADNMGEYNVWVATDQGSFYSANSGSSFNSFQAQAPSEAKTDNRHIYVKDDEVYIATSTGLYRTDLAGTVTWELLDDHNIQLISVPDYDRSTMFIAATTGLLRSDNFSTAPSFDYVWPSQEEFQIKDIAAEETAGVFYLATTMGAFKSTDFGQSWQVARLNANTDNKTKGLLTGAEWQAPTVDSNSNKPWKAITYGNGVFVAIANDGTASYGVMISTDGENWSDQDAADDLVWTDIAYGDDTFVAVANSGTGNRVMTSSDGETWTSKNSAADNDWTAITYGDDTFVAVANSGTSDRVMISSDNGENWTSKNSAADNDWTAITYGNGVFVAVANSGTGDRVMISSDNGENWTSKNSAADNDWTAITYGQSLFVAVAKSGTDDRVMISSDNGENWETVESAADLDWQSVTYGEGLFVAVAKDEDKVMTSHDGRHWALQTATEAHEWTDICYGNGLFVAISATDGIANKVMTSKNRAGEFTAVTSLEGRSGKVYLGDEKHLWLVGNTATGKWDNVVKKTNLLPPKITDLAIAKNQLGHYAVAEMWVYYYDKDTDDWHRISPNTARGKINFVRTLQSKIYYGLEQGLVSCDLDGDNESIHTLNSQEDYITTLAIKPTNELMLMAGTLGEGLYKSTDGGTIWVLDSSISELNINDVSYALDETTAWLATETAIYYSNDDGSNWVEACSQNVQKIIGISNTELYFLQDGDIYYSDDTCHSTQKISTDLTPSVNSFLVMDLTDSRLIYSASTAGVWKTTDEGANWTEVADNIRVNTHALTIGDADLLKQQILVGSDIGLYWFNDIKPSL